MHKCCTVHYVECFELYISLLYFISSRIFHSPPCNTVEYLVLLKEENSDSKSLQTHELQNAACEVSGLVSV